MVVFVDFPDDNTDPNNKAWPATYDSGRHPWQTTVNWSAKNRPPHPDLMGDVIDISITNPTPTGKEMEYHNVLPGYELWEVQSCRPYSLSAGTASLL